MKFYTTGRINAEIERPFLHDRPDLDVTVLSTGSIYWHEGETTHIDGTPAERGAFLRALSDAALAVADEIDRVGASA